jgi:hypothetical protein
MALEEAGSRIRQVDEMRLGLYQLPHEMTYNGGERETGK